MPSGSDGKVRPTVCDAYGARRLLRARHDKNTGNGACGGCLARSAPRCSLGASGPRARWISAAAPPSSPAARAGSGCSSRASSGRQGARITVAARDEAELERARQDLEERGIDVTTVVCDIANAGRGAAPDRRRRGANRPDRCARQQCRRHQGRAAGTHAAERLRGGHGRALLGTAADDDGGDSGHAPSAGGTDRQRLVDRRKDRRPAPRPVLREQVRARRPVGLRARRDREGRDLRDHGLPGNDAHRLAVQRVVQGPPSRRVRMVRDLRFPADCVDRRAARRAADRRRVPPRRSPSW